MTNAQADKMMARATRMMDRATDATTLNGDNSYAHDLHDKSDRLIEYVEAHKGRDYPVNYWSNR